jgi:hypothetical protein
MGEGTATNSILDVHSEDHRGGLLDRWVLSRKPDYAFAIQVDGPHLCSCEHVRVRVDNLTSTDERRTHEAIELLEETAREQGRGQPTPSEVAQAVYVAIFGPDAAENLRLRKVAAALQRGEDRQKWVSAHPLLAWLSQRPGLGWLAGSI